MAWREIAAALVLLLAAGAHGQVMPCTEDGLSAIGDGRMQRAAEGLQRAEPALSFQADPSPCVHARQTAQVLARTVGRNPWPSITGYEYFKAVHGDTYFTVERLRMRNPRQLQALAASLEKRPSRRLATKANTVYRSLVLDGSLVLVTSPAPGREKNAALLERIGPLLSE